MLDKLKSQRKILKTIPELGSLQKSSGRVMRTPPAIKVSIHSKKNRDTIANHKSTNEPIIMTDESHLITGIISDHNEMTINKEATIVEKIMRTALQLTQTLRSVIFPNIETITASTSTSVTTANIIGTITRDHDIDYYKE